MISKTNFTPAWACALSTFILAGSAHAQGAPPPALVPLPGWVPLPALAHVSIQSTPSTELELLPAGASPGSAAVARCTQYCDFWTAPGRYTLYAHDQSTGKRKELPLRVKTSSRFELQTGDDEARTAGLCLGAIGAASLGIGLIMIGASAMSHTGDHGDTGAVGLGFLVAGAVTTPIGWSMYSSNRTRLTRIDGSSEARTQTATQFRMGVMGVGLGGLGFGGMATF